MNTFLASTAAALSAAAVLTLGAAGTAHADAYGLDDPSDTTHGSDLRAVDVQNRDHKLVVVTSHENLRRDPSTGSGGSLFIDTDPENPGPEYVFAAGFTTGTDYALIETDGFRTGLWGEAVDGDYGMRVNYRDDRVRFMISRDAIGSPDEVRIALRVGGLRSDGTSHGLLDWLGQPRHFTPWGPRG
jgi:hypothetical protein